VARIGSNSLLIHIGQLWIINIPHTDDPSKTDRRPAVIVGWSQFGENQDRVILFVPITTFGGGGHPRSGDVKIPDPAQFGLSPNSYVHARRITPIHPILLTPNDGPKDSLDMGTMDKILKELETLFDVPTHAFVK
jgi:mRNA-degrading endonuclease toxin of MazEF toxin-antitoxin module